MKCAIPACRFFEDELLTVHQVAPVFRYVRTCPPEHVCMPPVAPGVGDKLIVLFSWELAPDGRRNGHERSFRLADVACPEGPRFAGGRDKDSADHTAKSGINRSNNEVDVMPESATATEKHSMAVTLKRGAQASVIVVSLIAVVSALGGLIGLIWTMSFVSSLPGRYSFFSPNNIEKFAPLVAFAGAYLLLTLTSVLSMSGIPFLTVDTRSRDARLQKQIRNLYLSLSGASLLFLGFLIIYDIRSTQARPVSPAVIFLLLLLPLGLSLVNSWGDRKIWFKQFFVRGMLASGLWVASFLFCIGFVSRLLQPFKTSVELPLVTTVVFVMLLLFCSYGIGARKPIPLAFGFVFLIIVLAYISPRYFAAMPFRYLNMAKGEASYVSNGASAKLLSQVTSICPRGIRVTNGSRVKIIFIASIGNRYLLQCGKGEEDISIMADPSWIPIFR